MNPVIVRDVKIGEGIPKICVPLLGETVEEIISEAENLCDLSIDLVEWRADHYQDVFEMERVIGTLGQLRMILGNVPLLFTFRTKQEGGKTEITAENYRILNQAVIESGCVDLIDVEMLGNKHEVEFLVAKAHQEGVLVIGSNHDFEKTPSCEEIVEKLCDIQEMGADILKVAVMARSRQDMLTVLSATDVTLHKHAKQPVVTMAMGKDGVFSRVLGEVFGSAITFGSSSKASAPGQIPAVELKETLEMIHHLLENR